MQESCQHEMLVGKGDREQLMNHFSRILECTGNKSTDVID